MGAYKRVDFTGRDKQMFYLLYKHRYADFQALNALYPKANTLYVRLNKLTEFGYIKKFNLPHLTIPLYSITMRGRNWLAQNLEKEFSKSIVNEIKMSSIYNLNHHLLIAEIGAVLTSKNIDYEIDLTCKKQYPELKITPDIVIEKDNKLTCLEIELEYKGVAKYAKKLSQLQTGKGIEKLIYLTRRKPETLKDKINAIDRYNSGATLDEKLIRNQTKNKIEYVKLDEFIQDIGKYIV